MNKKLNLGLDITIYSDAQITSNPFLRDVYLVRNASTDGLFDTLHETISIAPSSSIAVFDGTIDLNLDANSEASIALYSGNKFKLTMDAGGGTFSGFRIDREPGLDNTSGIQFVKLTPKLVQLETISGTDWNLSNVMVGDLLKIENASTFNADNKGTFKVKSIDVAGDKIVIENENAVEETITLNSASNLLIFSSTGVQEGDTLALASPFNINNRNSYTIAEATPFYLIFAADTAIPESAIDGIESGGLIIYNRAYSLLYIEVQNGKAALKLNDATDQTQEIESIISGAPGLYLKTGNLYKIEVQNLSNENSLSVRIVASQLEQ